jgi:hypothetical protein
MISRSSESEEDLEGDVEGNIEGDLLGVAGFGVRKEVTEDDIRV